MLKVLNIALCVANFGLFIVTGSLLNLIVAIVLLVIIVAI